MGCSGGVLLLMHFFGMRIALWSRLKRLPLAIAAIPACMALQVGDAKALLVYELIEDGSDVRVNISGSLTDLPPIISPADISFGGGFISPSNAIILTDDFNNGNLYPIDGPGQFGNGDFVALSSVSVSNNSFLFGSGNYFSLQSGYVEGAPITGTGLIVGQSLSTLGLDSTSGLLGTWTVGSDSIEVWAGAKPAPPSAVPGPLPLLGAGAAFAYSRRLRSRLRAGRPTLTA